jgi:hypothetical protein
MIARNPSHLMFESWSTRTMHSTSDGIDCVDQCRLLSKAEIRALLIPAYTRYTDVVPRGAGGPAEIAQWSAGTLRT